MLKTRMEFGLQINAASWMFWYFAILKIGFLNRICLLHNLVYSVTEQTVKPRMMATTKICGMHWFFLFRDYYCYCYYSLVLVTALSITGRGIKRANAGLSTKVHRSHIKKSDLFVLYFFYGDLHGDIIFVSFLFSF